MNEPESEISQLIQLFELSVDHYPDNIAIMCDTIVLTYYELEQHANRLANYLIQQGVGPKHSVGIFLERSLDSYVSILAVLKTGAAYVPLEVEFPDERINYILEDMDFYTVITSETQLRRTAIHFPNTIALDQHRGNIAAQSTHRPKLSTADPEQVGYVIYTSGSTGKPKGVAITQHNIVHYVTVASNLYQMRSSDRVYQGFSLAFDASLEELWMAFANGASLVACTSKDIRSGMGLIDFLQRHEVSFFSTVPTLLATIQGDLPHLRILILGGEACTNHLISRWHRNGLRIVNTYGPTEATVISTYDDCAPNKAVTIGKPLPGYDVLILDENLQPVANGQQGELCISGHGLAQGYVNNSELTQQKFIRHPVEKNQRLYRTGDLALINAEGNIEFLGRIDDQVKLRGFRIELNEIEAVIKSYPGIRQAVVSLQELDNPTLVAYLLIEKNQDVNLQQLKQFIQTKLPQYMIPTLFEQVESFPVLSSGKIDRKNLPKPSKPKGQERDYVPPQTELERLIAGIWEKDLQHHPISINADFFYDLGGHSLSAAKIVSNLRQIPQLQEVSILDLYRNPTIQQLAQNFNTKYQTTDERESNKHSPSSLVYYLCGIGQFFGCLLQHAVGAWQLLAIILCYSWVNSHPTLSKESIFIFLTLFLSLPIASMIFTICTKWLLVGRIKPGVYKLWGWFYLRWWLVSRLQKNIFSPDNLIGSPLIVLYYRLLGAKIGKNCYIGSAYTAVHDLISIGDNSSIGFDAKLLGYVVEDGWLKIGAITIGQQCYVGSRSVISINSVMENNSKLDDMSMLPPNSHVPYEQFYSGSPARPSQAPSEHITNQCKSVKPLSSKKNVLFGILHYLCLVFTMMVYYCCYLPALLLITHFDEQTHYLLTVTVAAPIGAVIFLGLHYLGIGICKKLLMNKLKPGIYSLQSLYYLRQWTIVKMLDIEEIYVMADTLYFPHLMRFLGAKLGAHVEMGETPHIFPNLLTIQDEGFVASAVALAWPNVYQGAIHFAPVQIGKRGFVGNMSLLPLGSSIGDGGLLGCMTITPPNNLAANNHTAWLGSPAVFLPKRETHSGFSDTEKFLPSKKLYRVRLAIEFIRIIMPTAFTLIELFNLLYVLNILFANCSLSTIFMVLPVVKLLVTVGLVAGIILLKWVMLGTLKPAIKPIWNIFIWKNDVIEYLYSYFVNPHLTNSILGTPFVSVLLRCFGAKIGKKVFIDTADFTEFDLIRIGDQVCINPEATIQTHLYEDRIFKMSTIDIKDGANIGTASIVLYSTIMEINSTLGNFSLLMKGEQLPANSRWQGIPAQSIHSYSKNHAAYNPVYNPKAAFDDMEEVGEFPI